MWQVIPYPPTIEEIAAYPIKSNDHLENLKKWRIDAAEVPEETRRYFHKQMRQLVKDKAYDNDSQL